MKFFITPFVSNNPDYFPFDISPLYFCLSGGPGFEPRLSGPEPLVLPLHHPPLLKRKINIVGRNHSNYVLTLAASPACSVCGTPSPAGIADCRLRIGECKGAKGFQRKDEIYEQGPGAALCFPRASNISLKNTSSLGCSSHVLLRSKNAIAQIQCSVHRARK